VPDEAAAAPAEPHSVAALPDRMPTIADRPNESWAAGTAPFAENDGAPVKAAATNEDAPPVAAAEPVPLAPAAMPAMAEGVPDARAFRECPECPVMVGVPGGAFIMGSGSRDPAAAPAHRVLLAAFALGRYPVTVAEWRACMADGGCGPLPRMAIATDETPLHNASWDDARQYVTWLGRRSGKPYRLPSEAEWEYAARAGTTTRYWWGEELGQGMADCIPCGSAPDARAPLPVDGLRANAFGLHGMLGSVAQWTADCWSPNYRGAPADGSARDAPGCLKKVLRGGGFRALPQDLTVTARGSYDAPVRYLLNGFRVARDLDR